MGADKNAGKAMRDSHSRAKRSSPSDSRRLAERMKELECFYKIADLVENPSISFTEMLQGIAEALPPAFQYPEICAARLLLDGEIFRTSPLDPLSPGFCAPITVHGMERGLLDVYYLQERSAGDEGPFLYEERRLLDAVAERVGRIVERREAEEAVEQSQGKFRAMFNSAGDAIFVTSLDGRILDANQAAVERYGYTREELLSMSRGDFRGDDFPLTEPLDLDLIEKNEEPPLETVHKRKDGAEFPVERVRRLIEYDGHPAILAAIRDITERKKVERALAESREEYKAIANLSGDIILKADALGRITLLNDGACDFYGKSREELLETNFRVLRHPEDHTETDALHENQRSSGLGVHGYVNRHLSAQGWRTVQWNTSPLFDVNGEYDGFQATGRDITDQIKTEEELRWLNTELEGFAHTVSHDLRGPLAAILLASEAFTDFAASPGEAGAEEQMLRMAEVIRRNVDRSKSLISDLITLARADRFNEETETIDIGRVVNSILEEQAAEITEKSIEVEVDADLGQLVASSTHVYQLFNNLITNAIKYCNGVNKLCVQLTHTGPDDAGHHYVLRDNGPGIPEEVLERVFEPFVKGDGGGSGIGLAIVAKIVNVYGGSIQASNDGGAVFSFNLHDAAS